MAGEEIVAAGALVLEGGNKPFLSLLLIIPNIICGRRMVCDCEPSITFFRSRSLYQTGCHCAASVEGVPFGFSAFIVILK